VSTAIAYPAGRLGVEVKMEEHWEKRVWCGAAGGIVEVNFGNR
jgi:hypothetical protein